MRGSNPSPTIVASPPRKIIREYHNQYGSGRNSNQRSNGYDDLAFVEKEVHIIISNF